MQKKYLKYILLTFVVFFGFNFEAFAKLEVIDMKTEKLYSNACYYSYDIHAGTVYETSGKGIGVTSDSQHHDNNGHSHGGGGSNSSNQTFNLANNTNASDFYISNKFTCIPMYVYVFDDEIQGTIIDVQSKEKSQSAINAGWEFKGKINGTAKKFATSCKYTADGGSFVASFDISTNKFSYSLKNAGGTIKSTVKKNWNYDTNGIKCRDDIVIDICGEVVGLEQTKNITVRTKDDKMNKTCYKSTSPGGITVSEKKEVDTGTKILFLSDICEESANTLKVIRFIGYLLVIVKILIPIGLIATGIISFSKAMIAGNEDTMKSTITSFAWKIVIAIVVFILPTVINFVIAKIDGASDGTEDYANCRNCIFNPKECSIPEE